MSVMSPIVILPSSSGPPGCVLQNMRPVPFSVFVASAVTMSCTDHPASPVGSGVRFTEVFSGAPRMNVYCLPPAKAFARFGTSSETCSVWQFKHATLAR